MSATTTRAPFTQITGMDACLKARRRWLTVLGLRHAQEARQRLVREYLPSLRALDTGALDSAIAAVLVRLEAGFAFAPEGAGQTWVHEGQRADDLAVSLLAEYEVLLDARGMQEPAGAAKNTVVALLARVEAICLS